MRRKASILLMLAVLLMTSLTGVGFATEQKYPSKTIEMIVGYGAGGGVDILARMITMDARKTLGVPLVVLNMPGAATVEATHYVQSQPADGYTVFGATPTSIYNNPLSGRVDVMPDDWIPVLRAHVDVGSIMVRSDSPFKEWSDLVDYAKQNPNKLNWGIVGALSIDEIASSVLVQEAGIEVKFVTYEAGGEMQAALLGGHIDVMYEEPGIVMQLIEANKMRPLIIISDKRLERFPDIAAVGDLGYTMPPMLWRGFFVKKGTPPDRVKTLEAALLKAMESPLYRAYERESLLDLYEGGCLGAEAFVESMKQEVDSYKRVLSDLGYLRSDLQ
jgi:putative tricarboxylic transport membrane protein